jgi:ribosomal protein S18 acetylase RimI-like enzyme
VSRALRTSAATPLTLHAPGVSCRVRPWPYDPQTAQLTLFHRGTPPPADVVAGWADSLFHAGWHAVRTGAVPVRAAPAFEAAGFDVAQTLVLLEHTDLHRTESPAPRTRRLTRRTRGQAAVVDRAAFASPWAIDETSIEDICSATARHRLRRIDLDGRLAGFAVSGRERHDGFLQRLAVHPLDQGRGAGRALTLDALCWMRRRGARRALVNTHSDNGAALALYRSVGFRTLPDPLIVFERSP